MSKFICQELLYEFATGNLDLERQKTLDAHLTGCRESQRELEKLKAGFHFTARLSKVSVSPDLRAALLGFEPAWKRNLREWTLWWSNYGWKALPYVVLIAVIVLSASILKPWTYVNQKEVVILDVPKTKAEVIPPPLDVKVEPSITTPSVIEKKETPDDPPVRAFLLRGEMRLKDLATHVSPITEKISALGGKVVGKQELGKIGENGAALFNFSIPESNRAELETYLKTFGPVQFKQEPHPRVMPDGEIHLILTLKDGGTDEPREKAETP